MTATERHRLTVDGRVYCVDVLRKTFQPPDAPRLVMVGYHPNVEAAALTRVALRSMRKFITIPHELWVADNNSPKAFSEWLYDQPEVNVIFNHTEPLPPCRDSWPRHILTDILRPRQQITNASYANGLGLQLVAKLVDPQTHIFGVFHNDVLVCKAGWLCFLISKLSDTVRGAAVATHTSGLIAMSASGFLFDFSLFRRLKMHFLPNMPHWDAAELITVKLNEAGYRWFLAENTFNSPELVERIPESNPLRYLHCDRSFDDDGDVFFLHMGRGAVKVTGRYHQPDKTYPEQWIRYAEEHLLS